MSASDQLVGATSSASLQVDDDRIEAFAEISGDTNPIHLDEEVAEQTRFRGRIAHGMLVESAISAAIADLPGTVSWIDKNLSYIKPVRPGETVTVDAEILENEGNGFYTVGATVTDGSDDPVIESNHTVLIDDPVAADGGEGA